VWRDLCARGGGEFLLVLPETGEEEAVSVAGWIQDWLVGHRVPTREGGMLADSVSLGVGSLRESDPELGGVIARRTPRCTRRSAPAPARASPSR